MTGDPRTPGEGSSVVPDVLVGTALQLLPIPPHGDDFWVRLEAALDAEPRLEVPVEPVRRVPAATSVREPSAAPGPLLDLAPAHSLALVPPAFRRTSNAVLVVVAAAAVVIVGLAGTTLLEERQSSTADGPAPSAALETLMTGARSIGATVTTLSAANQDASSEAVLAWVDDLGHADAEAAWAAMGDSSQAHFATQAEFESLMTDLADGYGAWSAADPAEVQVTPVSAGGDDGTIAVVTLLGAVEQEGTSGERVDAFPVRIVDGDVVVEPFASAGDLEVVIPEPAGDSTGYEQVGTGEELVFVLPGDAEAPVVRIDGGDTVICGEAEGSELSDLDGSTGQRCAYLPEGGFGAGPHTVTIAFVGPDGDSVTAESLRFEAA